MEDLGEIIFTRRKEKKKEKNVSYLRKEDSYPELSISCAGINCMVCTWERFRLLHEILFLFYFSNLFFPKDPPLTISPPQFYAPLKFFQFTFC